MTDAPEGAAVRAYTVRLELADEPGELLGALSPIAENGGNLLSIFHDRGSVTPRGRIPVEVGLEASPGCFETIVEALSASGVTVVQAGPERYRQECTVLLVGALVETDLSDTLSRIESSANTSIADVSLSAPGGTDEASARVRLTTETGGRGDVLETIREIAAEKDLHVVEPLAGGER